MNKRAALSYVLKHQVTRALWNVWENEKQNKVIASINIDFSSYLTGNTSLRHCSILVPVLFTDMFSPPSQNNKKKMHQLNPELFRFENLLVHPIFTIL